MTWKKQRNTDYSDQKQHKLYKDQQNNNNKEKYEEKQMYEISCDKQAKFHTKRLRYGQ